MREQLVLQALFHVLEFRIELGMEDDGPGHGATMDQKAYGVKDIFSGAEGDERHKFSTFAASGGEECSPTH